MISREANEAGDFSLWHDIWQISMCENFSCFGIWNDDKIRKKIQKSIEIKAGDFSDDLKFSGMNFDKVFGSN